MKQRSTAEKVLGIIFSLIPMQTLLLGLVLFFLALWKGYEELFFQWIWVFLGTIVAEIQLLWGIHKSIFSQKSISHSPLSLPTVSIVLGGGYFFFFSTFNTESMFFSIAPAYTIFCLLFPLSAVIAKLRKKLLKKQQKDDCFSNDERRDHDEKN